MLVTSAYSKNDIVSFKLVNGDEVVAKIVDVTTDSYVVSLPTTVMPSQGGIGLIQSLFTSDLGKDIPILKTHVMMHAATIQEIQNHYIQTTTGIQPVSSGIIT